MKQTVIIAGLGLIGGSIAKAIQQTGEYTLIGYDTDEDTCTYAKENKIIDEISDDFLEDLTQAHVTIVEMPMSITIQFMKELDTVSFDHNVIVTDVASIKGKIIQEATQITNDKITSIGGHPMAGSHK